MEDSGSPEQVSFTEVICALYSEAPSMSRHPAIFIVDLNTKPVFFCEIRDETAEGQIIWRKIFGQWHGKSGLHENAAQPSPFHVRDGLAAHLRRGQVMPEPEGRGPETVFGFLEPVGQCRGAHVVNRGAR
ncbi:hypothetical protein AD929_05195 [Gluconobacter potus]|uniref:Uncharacterized protein n=1 Tax=Gluconobacter potus TaxID=2724927 RepID=A0A149QWP8_9PROT|nr:hypothetical protein AD929_05195 [Gluconobacter potus]